MKGRMLIVGVIAAVALGGSSLALGATADHRVALPDAVDHVRPLPKSLAHAQRAVDQLSRVRVRCRTLRCLNGALSKIATAFDTLGSCMSYINIARYPGYMYSNDGGATEFQTTALDEADPGEPATKVMTIAC
jgi:hypothetical protein